ncbi:expressed unknown protein [Seminavis robusta]|uniref:F-box domain-containing protein n=1 Tax=Seminavis robusta TaxID=568900 RepID=A0A9N8DZ48_9STRA|nr:expressed unknown protein [Seminavis robusta]|eukprot:Sro489_g153350.1 n/a (409) ;mRNA; f:49671-50897
MSGECSNQDAGQCALVELPETILGHIVDFLTFSEAHGCLYVVNRSFWFQHRPSVARTTVEVTVDACNITGRVEDDDDPSRKFDACLPMTKTLEVYSNLRVLDLQSLATDELLGSLMEADCLPQLTTIRMRRSRGVTDQGLKFLSRHNNNNNFDSRSQLEEIDITFCQNTTYRGTFPLRDKLPHLKLLRRQPEWLDGHFHTPFGDSGGEVEVHTYWPDGTFSFHRATQSTGFVLSWNELQNNNQDPQPMVGDRLQFNNFHPPAQWTLPEWYDVFRFAYRPGVCLLQLPELDHTSTTSSNSERHVLVGQRLRRLKAPTCLDRVARVADQIAVGTSRYVDPCTLQIDTELNPTRRHWLLISKMKVLPLEENDLMPPAELVEECRRTCQAMGTYGEARLSQFEDVLDDILSE